MKTLSPQKTAEILPKLLNKVNGSFAPFRVEGAHGAAVIMFEEEWRSYTETLYLQSIPGMIKSVKDGVTVSVDQLDDTLDW